MGGPRSLRAVATMAIAGVILLVSATVYLHPGFLDRPVALPRVTPTPPRNYVADLQVVSPTVAWACVSPWLGGAIAAYATVDGGASWRRLMPQVPSPPTGEYCTQVMDERHGTLRLGFDLYATADGGATWRQVRLPPGQSFGNGARFIDASSGWYLDLRFYSGQTAQPTAMWWTSDGGASWTELWRVDAGHPESAGVPLEGGKWLLGFRDASTGWMEVRRDTGNVLLATFDGGRRWSPVALPLSEPVTAFTATRMPDGSAVLVARTQTRWLALPSRDGGHTWEDARPIPTAAPGSGQSEDLPSFADHDHWSIASGRRVLVTSDAGRNWRPVATSLPAGITTLHDLWLTGGRGGWALAEDVSHSMRVLHTADGGAHWSQSPLT